MKLFALNVTLIVALPIAAHADIIPDRTTLEGILGGGGVLEDFETLDVPTGGQRADASGLLNSNSIFDGSGPGLVQPGADYRALTLWWNGNGYFELNTRTLGDSSGWRDHEITITYTTPVAAMGFDMQGYAGYNMSGTVSVYDTNNVLLGTTRVNGGFFGWEHAAGIGSVVVSEDTDGYIMIDNHLYGASSACAADFDGDGFVTGLDFDAFVAAFEAGDSSADFDHDGFITGLDFDAFVTAFETGCS